MSVFSLIVARKGSKGLKEKVVQTVNGKRLFEYPVEYSLGLSDKIKQEILTVVSSDSETIEDYCLSKEISFIKRSPELTSDTTRIEDVVYDAYKRVGKEFKYISLLYGNIPTRYPDEFLKALNFLETSPDYDAVLSMQAVEKYNPAWMFEHNEEMLIAKAEEGYRRQDLRKFIIHDGHTILMRSRYLVEFMKKGRRGKIMYEAFGKKIKPMLNTKVVIDIDTERDLELVQGYLRS